MFFGYNLILHLTIFPVNAAIILKEVLLEFFTLNQRRKGISENLSLGFSDITDGGLKIVYYIIPTARPKNKN